MYNFFVDPSQVAGDKITIIGSDVNHMKNVLRMKQGENIYISTGGDNGSYDCIVDELLEDSVVCTIIAKLEEGLELSSDVYLFQGLPKGDKMELIIQKAVELGVHEIIPVSTKRSVVKLDDKKAKSKRERWQGISEAAAKQSKRRIIPAVTEVMTMKQAIEYAKDFEIKLIPYENAEGMKKTKEIIESITPGKKVAIFIGPEGGLEPAEVTLAMEAGIEPITLGKRILRTETAGMTVLAWLMYQLEE